MAESDYLGVSWLTVNTSRNMERYFVDFRLFLTSVEVSCDCMWKERICGFFALVFKYFLALIDFASLKNLRSSPIIGQVYAVKIFASCYFSLAL